MFVCFCKESFPLALLFVLNYMNICEVNAYFYCVYWLFREAWKNEMKYCSYLNANNTFKRLSTQSVSTLDNQRLSPWENNLFHLFSSCLHLHFEAIVGSKWMFKTWFRNVILGRSRSKLNKVDAHIIFFSFCYFLKDSSESITTCMTSQLNFSIG